MVISSEKSPLNEIGFENDVFQNVPAFAVFRESGKKVTGKGSAYQVGNFNYGLIVPGEGRMGKIGMLYNAKTLRALPTPATGAIRPLPPSRDWVDVHTLGVTGDGATDDTAAIQKAIDTHSVLYFPAGHYVVRDTLMLKPDTALIGLHPTLTQIDLLDGTPGYGGVGTPRAVISAPQGGSNILSGFGVFTGGINARATGVLWRAGRSFTH